MYAKLFCGLIVLCVIIHWRASYRLLKQIEVLTSADKLPSNEAGKLWSSVGVVLATASCSP
jgi:hypothetical protein